MKLLRPGGNGANDLETWLEVATDNDDAQQLKLYKLTNQMRTRVAHFNLPYLFLPVGTEKPTVLSVFVKMNTRQVRLSAFEIVVAEVEAEAGESLHDLVSSLNEQVPKLSRYGELSDLVLDASALLQNRPPNQAGYFGID